MKYYETVDNEKIKCLLCRHHCILKEGQVGICGINMNKNGELINLAYGHPSSINVDPVEKKPLFHFLPGSDVLSFGTVGCNFRCPFCQKYQ
jgi:pyruvate formate lyase activating enzyme